MSGVIHHIENTFAKPVFSEVIYVQNVGQIVTQDRTQEGARCIYTQNVFWVPTNTGTTFSFLNQFGNIIFTTVDLFTIPTYAPLIQVKSGGLLKVACTLPGIDFTVSYQYVL